MTVQATQARPVPPPTPGGAVRSGGYAVAAVLCAVAAWWLARHGVATDTWPAFVPDAASTQITRYSGAWLTAAAAAALAAALLLVAVVRRVVRSRSRPVPVAAQVGR